MEEKKYHFPFCLPFAEDELARMDKAGFDGTIIPQPEGLTPFKDGVFLVTDEKGYQFLRNDGFNAMEDDTLLIRY
jgi:hypothetical protein